MEDGNFTPSGTVTFLLTDIEASTRTWEADPDVMAPAVAWHYELLDQAITEHRGVRPTEQGEGDSVVGAFAKASDAVAAALTAQRALIAELGSRFRVRIAIHTGEARLRPDRDGIPRNYVGPAIIRAARLRACGHGGQVLVSTSAADLAADLLPAQASLADLGSHRLRDLVRPERIFQLIHPDLPAGFPRLLSLDESPNTLPTPLTSLLGRHAELIRLPDELAAHRLVTLTGAGGVGKTRLAQQVAADLIDRYPGGTWWVELAPASTREAVLAALADGTRLNLQPVPDAEEQLLTYLAPAEATVVVLDNCEHVLDIIAPLAHRVLTRCPAVSVFATSREPLGVPGEHVWRVPSLAAPKDGEVVPVEQLEAFDAVSLFVERASAARPNFVVDEHSAPHIAAICTRLDGIALAIELAAARTRSLPVDRLAAGLDQTFRLLAGGPRMVVPRQQTLLASIAWSYDLLDRTDQTVLCRLSVCPAGFDVDAAEAIAAGGDVQVMDVLDSVTRLVDKSLTEYDDTTSRYRMLETIRQFGLDQLAAGEGLEKTLRRHADHWSARALRIGAWGSFDPVALRAALPDTMAMLEWAMARDADLADRVLTSISITVFGLRWPAAHRACDWVLADRHRGPYWPGAVGAVSVMAMLIGRLDVLGVTDDALRLAEEVQDTSAARHLRMGPAYANCYAGHLSAGRALVIDATAAGDDFPAFSTATMIMTALAPLGQLDELNALCRLSAELAGRAGLATEDCAVGPAQAVGHRLAGDLDRAVRRLPGHPVAGWELFSRLWAAVAARLAVDLDDASLAEQASGLIGVDDSPFTALYPHVVAWGHAVLDGDLERAAVSAQAAAASALQVADRAEALTELAATFAGLNRWEEATTALDQLDGVLSAITEPAPLPRTRAAVLRGRIALATGRLGAADEHTHEALRTASGAGLRLVQIDALEAVGALATAADEPAKAARLTGAAEAERRRRGYRGRLTSAIPQAVVDQLAADEPTAWADGTALTLVEATAFALRSRGPRGRPSFGFGALTPTEQLVVEHVKQGHTNAEIAAKLLVTVPTVKTHLTRIFTKLGVRNRAELAALAAQIDEN